MGTGSEISSKGVLAKYDKVIEYMAYSGDKRDKP